MSNEELIQNLKAIFNACLKTGMVQDIDQVRSFWEIYDQICARLSKDQKQKED